MPAYRVVIAETADKKLTDAKSYDASGMESGGYVYGASSEEPFDVFDEQITARNGYQACIDGLNKYRHGGK